MPAISQWSCAGEPEEGDGAPRHLIPQLGNRPLDVNGAEDVQRLKGEFANKSAKTVNNVLTVVNTLLKPPERLSG